MEVANPGSALSEAIGSLLEAEIHRLLRPIAEQYGAIYVTTPKQLNEKKRRKLILTDQDGNDYEVDAVIVNRRFQPLVLLESKYIRYKKHNRDKASWICTAHTKLKQKFPTVRCSIAVLMGSWSKPSKRLLTSFGVTLFEIGFDRICDILSQFGVNYRWSEKDRQAAMEAWRRFNMLNEEDKIQIAKTLIADISAKLQEALKQALDESTPRRVQKVTVFVSTNRGESFIFTFNSVQQATLFLREFDETIHLDTTRAPTLIKPSPEKRE